MNLPAGVEPPAPDEFDDVGVVHAIDGDSTALCVGTVRLEQVDHHAWTDVPLRQRCTVCSAMLGDVNS